MPRSDGRVGVIFDTSLESLVIVDDRRRYLHVNEPATKLLGASEEQIVGRWIENFTPPEQQSLLARLWAQLRSDGELAGRYEVLRGDGLCSTIEFRAKWGYGNGEHLVAAREVVDPRQRSHGPAESLTQREREVLQLAAEGYPTSSIAAALFLSPVTVKTHFQNIFTKLGAHDRAGAVATALRGGVIS